MRYNIYHQMCIYIYTYTIYTYIYIHTSNCPMRGAIGSLVEHTNWVYKGSTGVRSTTQPKRHQAKRLTTSNRSTAVLQNSKVRAACSGRISSLHVHWAMPRHCSENANLEWQRCAWNADFAMGPQRKCEFRVSATRLKGRICYGTAAKMRI